MAVNFTLSSADAVTAEGVTVTFAKGDGSSNPAWYDNGLRLYANNTVTVTSESTITAITFNWEQQGSKAFNTATASVGEYTHPTAAGEGKWTGSATTVTFTLGATGQLLLNTFSVTLGEGGEPEPVVPVDTVDVVMSKGLIWADEVATEGWWDIYGSDENYSLEISNLSTTETAGTYGINDLDPDYTFIVAQTAPDDTIHFTAGEVVVAITTENVVTVKGALLGENKVLYNIDLTYKDPVAEKTVVLNIPQAELYEEYADYGLYAVYGDAEDGSYVQLAIWAETGFQGQFTKDDLDYQYVGSFIQIAGVYVEIFSADITVTPGNGEGVYKVEADLLCYDNVLYKVTMLISPAEQGLEDVNAAVKAVKSLRNGQLLIEKNGKTYNVQGAVVK